MHEDLPRRLESILVRLAPERAAGVAGGGDAGERVAGLLDALDAAAGDARRGLEAAEDHAAGLAQVVDFAGNGVVIAGADGKPAYRNAAASSLVGAPGSDPIAEQALDEQLLAAAAGAGGERLLELFSPQRRTLQVRSCPLRSESGAVRGAVAVIEDVSEKRRLDSIRRDFVANVSHELKTPVGALSLLAETLDGEDDPETVARLIARVASEAGRLGRIIDDLLDLSRIEANESALVEKIGVAGLIAEAVEPIRATARSRDIGLQVAPVAGDLVLAGDRRDLISAVTNLVDNAVKYSDPGSPVAVAARADGDMVEITVSDRGLGIPARDLERVFERFYRVDRARSRATGGTGLGLSIVRHVAVNHRGTVHVASVEGQGSEFTLRLPAAGPGGDASATEAAGTGAGGVEGSGLSPGDHPLGAGVGAHRG